MLMREEGEKQEKGKKENDANMRAQTDRQTDRQKRIAADNLMLDLPCISIE
jgi:hypothetical protein